MLTGLFAALNIRHALQFEQILEESSYKAQRQRLSLLALPEVADES